MVTRRELALNARAWPFEEARKILSRLNGKDPAKGYVLFETGYGPSGLPHIGTFGEVLRTTMVRQAFSLLCDIPTKLLCFSDDRDGLRKVPTNVPNQDLLRQHLHKPLTKLPDPFGCHESFGHHNNAMLRNFLDRFGFAYEFASASDYYTSGRFDQGMLDVLQQYEKIMALMLPTLGAERAATYSPFLPVDEESGHVLQVPVINHDKKSGTITYRRDDGREITTLVTGGRCKLQWKPDWAMRWHVLGVDYEMSGKDLIPTVKLSTQICKFLGSHPPEGFSYELFLDQNGEKISKSRGNGLTMEEWLKYGGENSLALFMFIKPRTGKKLYFDVIPKHVDDYYSHLSRYEALSPEEQLENPLFHIHNGEPPLANQARLSYGLLINLVAASNSFDKAILWGFIKRYLPDADPVRDHVLDALVGYAIDYYRYFVLPHKSYRIANQDETAALTDLRASLASLPADSLQDGEVVQTMVYDVGKRHGYENLRAWFQLQYEVLLGQSEGPRIGSFYALYGLDRTQDLINQALAGELVNHHKQALKGAA